MLSLATLQLSISGQTQIYNLSNASMTKSGQFENFVNVKTKLTSVFRASVLLLTMNCHNIIKVVGDPLGYHLMDAQLYVHVYSENVVMKFMISERTDAGKTYFVKYI